MFEEFSVGPMTIVNDSVSYPHSKSGDFTYEAETGQFILSWDLPEYNKYGRSGYHVSRKIAANSDFIEEKKIEKIFEELNRMASENGKEKFKEELESKKREFLELYHRVRSSHSLVEVHWNIKHDGSEFDRKGGGLHLGINLKMLRVNPNALEDYAAKIKSEMKSALVVVNHSSSISMFQPSVEVKMPTNSDHLLLQPVRARL